VSVNNLIDIGPNGGSARSSCDRIRDRGALHADGDQERIYKEDGARRVCERASNGLIASTSRRYELNWVHDTGSDEILIASAGKAIRLARPKSGHGPRYSGRHRIKLGKGDSVVGSATATPGGTLVITERGYGKRTRLRIPDAPPSRSGVFTLK